MELTMVKPNIEYIQYTVAMDKFHMFMNVISFKYRWGYCSLLDQFELAFDEFVVWAGKQDKALPYTVHRRLKQLRHTFSGMS
jgi:hypothetical protein